MGSHPNSPNSMVSISHPILNLERACCVTCFGVVFKDRSKMCLSSIGSWHAMKVSQWKEAILNDWQHYQTHIYTFAAIGTSIMSAFVDGSTKDRNVQCVSSNEKEIPIGHW